LERGVDQKKCGKKVRERKKMKKGIRHEVRAGGLGHAWRRQENFEKANQTNTQQLVLSKGGLFLEITRMRRRHWGKKGVELAKQYQSWDDEEKRRKREAPKRSPEEGT